MREWYAEPESFADIDLQAYAWDAPYDRPAPPEEPEPPQSDLQPVYDDDPYGFYEDDDWAYEDDDDDLLEALEEALDEVEAEDRLEAIRERAAPRRDVAELVPEPETLYREAATALLGQPVRPEAPRYSRIRHRALPASGGLDRLLEESLRRARSNLERWRIHGWAHDLPGAHLGQRRPHRSETTHT